MRSRSARSARSRVRRITSPLTVRMRGPLGLRGRGSAEDAQVSKDRPAELLIPRDDQGALLELTVRIRPTCGHHGEGVGPAADGRVGGAVGRGLLPGGEAVVPVSATGSLEPDPDALAVVLEADEPQGPGQGPDGQV